MLQEEAVRFLFRPRTWVRERGDCILRMSRIMSGIASGIGGGAAGADLASVPYSAVFVRDSVEKRAELSSHGHGLPYTSQLESVALAIAALLPPPHTILLQTSSALSFEAFRKLASIHREVRLVASDNPRSDRDGWAVTEAKAHWKVHNQTRFNQTNGHENVPHQPPSHRESPHKIVDEGTIAAVNLYLASRAEYFITLSSSAWSYLVADMMDGTQGLAPGAAGPVTRLASPPRLGSI